jgi:hypothetical protein
MNQKKCKTLRKLAKGVTKGLPWASYDHKEKRFFSRDMKNSVLHHTLTLNNKCTKFHYNKLKRSANGK